MGPQSDEALMRQYVTAGDAQAFAELFRRYADRVEHVFRGCGLSDEAAQDLLQHTFLQVHRARHDFRLDARFRPWLFAIAMNTRREHFRWRARRREDPLDSEGVPEPSVLPKTSTVTDRLVRRALASIQEDQREVILLHWFEELSFEEIGGIVGASTSAVKVRAHRGYEALRRLLNMPA